MKSPLLETKTLAAIEGKILSLLNKQDDFLGKHTVKITRGIGDAIQSVIEDNFQDILGELGHSYKKSTSQKSFADLSFIDKDENQIAVDVKTHRTDKKFSMPNLKSVNRILKFYESEKNILFLLIVKYSVQKLRVVASEVRLMPVEHFKWDSLQIAALGLGQIQFKNSKEIKVDPKQERRLWMQQFCEKALEFYPRQTAKNVRQLQKFKAAKEKWLSEADHL